MSTGQAPTKMIEPFTITYTSRCCNCGKEESRTRNYWLYENPNNIEEMLPPGWTPIGAVVVCSSHEIKIEDLKSNESAPPTK